MALNDLGRWEFDPRSDQETENRFSKLVEAALGPHGVTLQEELRPLILAHFSHLSQAQQEALCQHPHWSAVLALAGEDELGTQGMHSRNLISQLLADHEDTSWIEEATRPRRKRRSGGA